MDPLSATMLAFVIGVSALVHVYSIGYMRGDPGFSRFFVYLNLFSAAMLLLVPGGNLAATFVGWEGVGVCSYLLIAFWFEREAAAVAGTKASLPSATATSGDPSGWGGHHHVVALAHAEQDRVDRDARHREAVRRDHRQP